MTNNDTFKAQSVTANKTLKNKETIQNKNKTKQRDKIKTKKQILKWRALYCVAQQPPKNGMV